MRRFVMLDRDGTLIAERHYLSHPDQVELIPGAAEALKQMQQLGLGLVVLTNQSGVGRGYFEEDAVGKVHDRIAALLAPSGVEIDAFYFCPHLPDAACACRKPAPGLVTEAAAALGFAPEEAFMIGDKACDVDLGIAVGATSILVRTGHGVEEERKYSDSSTLVADSLVEVVPLIKGQLKTRQRVA